LDPPGVKSVTGRHDPRLSVWRRLPQKLFAQAVIDMAGTLANTGEMRNIVNRRGIHHSKKVAAHLVSVILESMT
jgi:hypothetical protein